MIEHEHLIAQHREAIEIVGPLVMRDRRDRGLQARDVRFERDRHAIAEPPLHAGADDAEEPGGGGGHADADRGGLDERGPLFDHALTEQHQPQARSARRAARRAARG